MQPDAPLQLYAEQRHHADDAMTAAVKNGDDPATVARAIVAAATDPKPKLRYTPGSRARQISTLRRIAPSRAFDSQIRKYNWLAAYAHPTTAPPLNRFRGSIYRVQRAGAKVRLPPHDRCGRLRRGGATLLRTICRRKPAGHRARRLTGAHASSPAASPEIALSLRAGEAGSPRLVSQTPGPRPLRVSYARVLSRPLAGDARGELGPSAGLTRQRCPALPAERSQEPARAGESLLAAADRVADEP